MKIENEVKYKIENIKKIKKEVQSLSFKFKEKLYQVDYYFSPPYKKFAGTKKYYLRLRKIKNNKGCFAYHIVSNDLKTREWEVKIDNFSEFLNILRFLNFKIDCIVKKRREIYYKNHIEIVVDQVEKLGNFIEIEYLGSFTKKIKEEFNSLIKKLKLDYKNKITNVGYPDLLLIKKND